MEQLVLIDGNSLLFRSYFAMRPMITSKGIYTQGLYAFIVMLGKIIKDYNPDYIGVCFDLREPTFRHKEYPEYKAGRLKTPDELLAEIPILHDILSAMNIKVLEMPGFEADDLIGTMAIKASKRGLETLIITGDKDELQLVDENTRVLINQKGMSEFKIYDIEAMRERYNLTPAQFIDLKGLMGDKSDNIPGIAGIGEKKGIALLEEYGTLEEVLNHASEIPGKMGETIRESIEVAKLSKWLATINTEVPLDISFDDLKYREPDYDKLIAIYAELEFNKFIKEIKVETRSTTQMSLMDSLDSNDTQTTSASDFSSDLSKFNLYNNDQFFKSLNTGDTILIETVTDNNHLNKPVISQIILLSCDKQIWTLSNSNEIELTSKRIAEKRLKLIGYNLKPSVYSMIWYSNQNFECLYDLMIAEYLLEPNHSKYPLSSLALRYLGASLDSAEVFQDALDISIEYSSNDLLRRLLLINEIYIEQNKSINDKGLKTLLDTCEMPLINTTANMEYQGIKCDYEVLSSIGTELDDKILALNEQIFRQAGVQFNINSPKQLGEILFTRLEIPYPGGAPKNGKISTSADILDKLSDEFPIVKDILDFRKLSKLKSTYVDGLLGLIGFDGRIRPHFNMTVAATGRLSCTEPNLQNIPVHDEYGKLIRKAFISDSGLIFTGSDYSQIELRILAALAEDQDMIDAFNQGKDIHRATASQVLGIPENEVTSEERSRAKAVNFGIIYGMSGFGLSENLKISRAEAEGYIKDYFAKHPKVREFLDQQISIGEETREIRTMFGRLRQIPEFASRKFIDRELAKRLAMNTPIQGTAADIIKIAMNNVHKALLEHGLKSRMILQIHDELIIEGPLDECEKISKLLDDCMKNAAELAVELSCEIHSATSWYELK